MQILGFFSISLVMLFSASTTSAETYSGVFCNSGDPQVNYSQFGVHNASTNAAKTVLCGGATAGTISSVSATVYDRSTSDAVRCTVFLTDAAGSTLFSAAAATSGFGSGSSLLSFSPPQIIATVVLQCSIPAVDSSNGFSHVTTYTITDSQ
jgi:hypothetical protein